MSKELKPIDKAAKACLPELVRLVQLYCGNTVDAQAIAQQEIEYLRMHALNNPKLQTVNPGTVALALKDFIKKNLSLDPTLGLVYVKSRSVKVGVNPDGSDKKIEALELQASANGKLSIARQCGRVLDHKRPEVTYDSQGRVVQGIIELLVPSHPQPRWERFVFDEYDFERWRKASHKERGRYKTKEGYKEDDPNMKFANALYTSWRGGPDPEFIRAKVLRHSLAKLGTNPAESGKYNRDRVFTAVDIDPIMDQETEDQDAVVVEATVAEAVENGEVKLPDADQL